MKSICVVFAAPSSKGSGLFAFLEMREGVGGGKRSHGCFFFFLVVVPVGLFFVFVLSPVRSQKFWFLRAGTVVAVICACAWLAVRAIGAKRCALWVGSEGGRHNSGRQFEALGVPPRGPVRQENKNT